MLESILAGKNLGVLVDTKLSKSQQYVIAAKKVDRILGCIRPSTASLLVSSTLSHLQYCVQF